MAAVCEVCGKKPSFGMSLSHSHRRTKRRWDPNIQRVRALVDGAPGGSRLHLVHPVGQGHQAARSGPSPAEHRRFPRHRRPVGRRSR